MRRASAFLSAALSLLIAATTSRAEPIKVTAEPLLLNARAPDQQLIGKLIYRGGLVLTSDANGFGGLSALGVSADGRRLISLTDKGRRFSAFIIYGENGDLAGLHRPQLDTLAGLDGNALTAKATSDAESMSPGVEGEIIVAFERRHRLWRYHPGQVLPEPLPAPDELAALPANSGIEGLALLADGRLFALAEGRDDRPATVAWVSHEDGWSVMTYATNGGFRPTGAATLPGGDVLVLERRFTLRSGVAVRIRRIAGSSITAGAYLKPSLVAELRPPLAVDNFEGIAVRPAPGGGVWVYMVSDDNFNPLQRTLLMMFKLPS